MSKNKLITNYYKYTDADLDVAASTAVTDLTGNANFTFNNGELTTLTAATTKYHNTLAALATGGTAAVIEKNAARTDLLNALNVIATQINLQANGDLLKLETTGMALVAQPQRRVEPMPGNLYVENGNGSDLFVSVDVSPAGDNGTLFAYTPVSNTVADPALWTIKTSNGHSVTIKGLISGTQYKITAAYKGNDDDDPVWAPVITKYAGGN